jgi:hypothetical protein
VSNDLPEGDFTGRCECGALLTIRLGKIPWHEAGENVFLGPEPTVENSPTLAASAKAAEFGIKLSSSAAAEIAEAVIAASGLRDARVEAGVAMLALHAALSPKASDSERSTS